MPPHPPIHSNLHGWHLKREIQLGHIITTLTVAAAAFGYIGKQEQRIALIEQRLEQQRERDERQDRSAGEDKKLFVERLDRMDAKLDRLIERIPSSRP